VSADSHDPHSWAEWFARWVAGAPNRWLGKRSAVAQDIAGGADGIKYLRHLVRGNRIRKRASFEHINDKSRPILLIHGFMGTRGSMFPLEERLIEDGYTVFSFNLGLINTRDIRRSAFQIHRKIEAILAQTALEEIDIIGHSMGGLIGLYYVKKLGGARRVRRLIMMGTPVNGTWVALAGIATMGAFSASTWQLLPRSRFLDELHQGQLPDGVEVHTLTAVRDWVCPPKSTRLRGARAHSITLGHSSLVISPEVYRHIISILEETPESDESEQNRGPRLASRGPGDV
jgi:pimeloyl-ACP methyl ester carboxylesterase